MAVQSVAQVIELFPKPPSAQVFKFPKSRIFRPKHKRKQPGDGLSAYERQMQVCVAALDARNRAAGGPGMTLEEIERILEDALAK